MSLGVLNNLNATYAEYNLNKTSSSLSKVLQQLSSGSKINSGSDDAAGLSLVNGLQANQQALTQSVTNATEGSGLLQVADGALSQVTSLLNRAITLATEVSNGTLNSSQQTAANQEYQSILSEISNIGSTTTYNGKSVFGSTTDIYTGDSTTTGSSINKLSITSLSSSNVGDTDGAIAYSSGKSVFTDLSSTSASATDTDAITGTISFTIGSTTYDFAASSSGVTVSKDGGTTTTSLSSTSATVSSLVSSINSYATTNDLGFNAELGSGTEAGLAATDTAATHTGIIVSSTNGSSTTVGITSASTVEVALTTLKDTTTSITGAAVASTNDRIATISYSDSAGTDLSSTALSSATNASTALTLLNNAVTNVSAEDGYIGAEINTLDSVSSVLSTQQENVQSAQDAVQATDYATASSNLSKYEILSQTGISALAQANSIQQEVTKLLQ